MDRNLLNHNITTQNTRADIIGELEAITQYENHLEITDDPAAKRTIEDIIKEEQVHVGQLFGLLFRLDPESKKQFELGYQEFVESNR